MLNKTAAGNFAPLLALGFAAALGGCTTQEDAQPSQFTTAPQIEAIYAHDGRVIAGNFGATLGLYDVQIWANPSDPHYPTLTGETGAQNAADVSLFPPDYNTIIVEVNTPLDGMKLGTTADLSSESFCTSGSVPANAPFQVIDVGSGNNTPLLGSICYDPTSQLFRYPELTFVVGSSVAFDPSANPFTCQDFAPDNGEADGASFKPTHQYAIVMNTSVDVNDNEIPLTIPTTAPWASGQFPFTTAGLDIMAVGYEDLNTGFFSYVEKPYLGFLKDCPVNATFCNPVDGTFSDPNPADGADGLNGNNALRLFTTLEVSGSNLANNITVTRQDGTTVDVNIVVSGSRGDRMFYIAPPVSWEPGQTYTVTFGAGIKSASGATTITTVPPPFTFTIPAGDPGAIAIVPSGPDYVIYGGLGNFLGGVDPSALNQFFIQFNVPLDPNSVNATNVTVTDSNNNQLAGTVMLSSTVQYPAAATQGGNMSDNHEIVFTPTGTMTSNTTYTITAANLQLEPGVTVPGLAANATLPTQSTTFTTSDLNAQVLIDNDPSLQLDGLGPTEGALFVATGGEGVPLAWGFTREAQPSTVTTSSVTLTEINQDGSVGAVVPAANLTITDVPATTDLVWEATVTYCTSGGATACTGGAAPYLVKCDQNYAVSYTTAITDEDETPAASLTAQSCTTGTTCSDVHTFTTTAFTPTFAYTPADPTTTPPSLDTFTVSFPGSLSAASANALTQPNMFMQVVDAMGNQQTVTCQPLADDTSSTITCTTPALAANATYTVSVLVPSSAACGPGTTTACPLTIASVATLDTGFADSNMNEIFDLLPADQVSCSFAGSIVTSITTPCGAMTTRAVPHHARQAKGLTRFAKPSRNTLD